MSAWMRWRGRLLALLVISLAATGGVYLPGVLREAETFRVRQVEVVGARFIEPYDVVRAAGLDRAASLFDDPDAWYAGIRTLSLIDDVRIRRTFPSTVTLEVREVKPVALVAGPTLRPVDGSGVLLDLDPAGESLDLPILSGVRVREGRLQGVSAAAVATLGALFRTAPEVAEAVSQAAVDGDAIRIAFRAVAAEAVLPASATPVQLTQLGLAMADLRGRGELDRVRTIDVRFRDQVVVSFQDRPVS